ncbi:MAG: NYN domain-containing protein [Syntrophorhabdales bacterium]|jgi:hypothetical protein
MALHLLIDGYNVIRRCGGAVLFDPSDLERSRRNLIDWVSRYKREKQIRITVVFDGGGGPSLARKRESHRGIEVIYSKKDETADQVIMEAIRVHAAGLVVATSDRVIIDEAKKHAIPFITPDRLEAALLGEGPGEEVEIRAGKKGNPRKAPKGVRLARRAIRKI